MKIPLPPADKARHFTYGVLAYVAGSLLALAAGLPEYRRVAGMGLTGLVAAGKEATDWWLNRQAAAAAAALPHKVEFADFFATVLGGAAACLGTVDH